jgi:hypothetical protein
VLFPKSKIGERWIEKLFYVVFEGLVFYCTKGVVLEETDVQYDAYSTLRFCSAVVFLIQITVSDLDWQTSLTD